MDEIFDLTSLEMKDRGIPTHQRKYILRCRELLQQRERLLLPLDPLFVAEHAATTLSIRGGGATVL